MRDFLLSLRYNRHVVVLELRETHSQPLKTRACSATYVPLSYLDIIFFQVRSSRTFRAGSSVHNGRHTRVHPTFAEDSAAVQSRSCGSNTSLTPSLLVNGEIEGIHQNGHCEPHEGRRRGDSPVITCVTCLSWCGVELLLELYSLRCSKFRKHAI